MLKEYALIINKSNDKKMFFYKPDNRFATKFEDLIYKIWLYNINIENHDIYIEGKKIDKEFFDKHLFTIEEDIKGISYERLLKIKKEKLELCLI